MSVQKMLFLLSGRGHKAELLENCPWLKKNFNSIAAIFAANTREFESAPTGLRIVGHIVDDDAS